ncbi:MAG: hypothetical protein Q4D32_01125 [Eubacteriales bacterium]|nr:hypothetical protein [Eubacteriales bacterium]
MMRKVVRGLVIAGILTSICIGNVVCSKAATSDEWAIQYRIPGAPTSAGSRTDVLYVSYYSDGFIGNCKRIGGENGRRLTIEANNAGGIDNNDKAVWVTTTGKTKSWHTKKAIKTSVEYTVSAAKGYYTTSTGIIKIKK